GRSTAPALAVAALSVAEPDKTVLVAMPADHHIGDIPAFQAAITEAARHAMSGRLMTLGIRPDKAHTGYGYIEMGATLPGSATAYELARFKEKPDQVTAETYLQTGKFLWNAGIFVVRADRYLAELEQAQPLIMAACRKAYKLAKQDLDFLRLDADAFAASPDLSIDYAIMEQVQGAGVLPVSCGWSDIGNWPALWQLGDKDEHGNVTCGDVMLQDVTNSYIRGDSRLVAVLGLDNIIVAETADALLVADMSRAEDVKSIVNRLNTAQRNEAHSHERVYRPWGYYETLNFGERFQVKLIMVKPEGKLSLQMHHHRAEHWIVVSGTAKVTVGNETRLVSANETAYIPLGVAHRLENPGKVPLQLIEVQSGDYLGEDDIVRFEDIYRRLPESKQRS
ncbi:MAG: mannose-1-phosphate guanylyltransferase/mannose-6-phosphate isomerase, partial [Proteobacteria bacterium]|nr:mannose-1-phosphate guanylyltransferase/mannose-6-phosphate isomerase [Pseudomonadota bacterium]